MKKNSSIHVYQRLLSLLNLDKKEIKQIYIYSIFYGLLSLILPLGIQSAIQFIQIGKGSTSFYMVVLFVIISIILAGYIQLMQIRIVENLQQKIYVRYAFEFSYRLSNIDFTKKRSLNAVELSNRFFETISLQKGLPKILIDLVGALLQILFGLLLLSFYHPVFIGFSIIIVILLVLSFNFSGRKGIDYGLRESKYKYKTLYWIQEIVRRKDVLQHSNSDFILEQSNKHIENYLINRERKFKVIWNQFLQLIGFKVLLVLFFFMIGAYLVFSSKMNLGQFIASEIIIILIINSVEKVISTLETVYELFASIEKIEQVIDMPMRDYKENDNEKWLFEENNNISFFQLEAALFPFNFSSKVKLNGTLSLDKSFLVVSENRNITSTFIQTLLRNATIHEGHIHVNNRSVNELSNNTYFSKVHFLSDAKSIFNGSLRTNLTLGNTTYTQQEINDVCLKTGLSTFIEQLEIGFETELSEVDYLTEELTFRISLGRLLLLKPQIVITDKFINLLVQKGKTELLDLLFDPSNSWIIITNTNQNELLHRFEKVLIIETENVELQLLNTTDHFDKIKKMQNEK